VESIRRSRGKPSLKEVQPSNPVSKSSFSKNDTSEHTKGLELGLELPVGSELGISEGKELRVGISKVLLGTSDGCLLPEGESLGTLDGNELLEGFREGDELGLIDIEGGSSADEMGNKLGMRDGTLLPVGSELGDVLGDLLDDGADDGNSSINSFNTLSINDTSTDISFGDPPSLSFTSTYPSGVYSIN